MGPLELVLPAVVSSLGVGNQTQVSARVPLALNR